MPTSLPNLLTFSRILVIPILVGLFWVEGNGARWIACLIFTLAGITDYLDGYLARSWRQQSHLGVLLDPIADKLLVGAALICLAGFGRIQGLVLLPAIIILCREILVSGLREFLASLNVGLPVTRLAKWKTGLQMVSIGFLIVGDAGDWVIPYTRSIGELGLWCAAILTLITGYDYLRQGLRHIDATGTLPVPERSAMERPVMERPIKDHPSVVKGVEPAKP